jgi:uroporphyrin-III C-methyltransferase
MLFGRAHEEISFLKEKGVRCEVVPGVSAAFAASAQLGVSLTRRGEARSVAFVTPRTGAGERENNWVRTVLNADTAAIYMGAGEAEAIAAALIAAGKAPSTPVVVVENASLPGSRQSHGALGDLARVAQGSGGPMLILLGEVYRDSAIIAAWRQAQSSSSPTARATRAGRLPSRG